MISLDYAWMNYNGLWGWMITRWGKAKAALRVKKQKLYKSASNVKSKATRKNKRQTGWQRESEKIEHTSLQSRRELLCVCAYARRATGLLPGLLLANYQSIAPSERPVRQTFFKWRQSAFVVRLRRRVSRGEKKKRDINPSEQCGAASVRSPPRLYL
jgi:hypothetical protein